MVGIWNNKAGNEVCQILHLHSMHFSLPTIGKLRIAMLKLQYFITIILLFLYTI